MINVVKNNLDSKYIDSYWLNNIILDQEKNRNKESLNNKYEVEIKIDDTEFNDQMENNKYITKHKEQNYSEPCRKFYIHNSYKKDSTNYQKRESFVKTNRYEKKDKKDIYGMQSKPRIYEYMSANKKSDIFSTDRESDIIIKSWSRNNL